MVYALQKFRHYLLGVHFKMFTDHFALKYFVNKHVLGGNICRWLLLFQEYDFEVIVSGKLDAQPNHLSGIKTEEEPTNIEDNLNDAQLFVIRVTHDRFMDIIQFLTTGMVPMEYTMKKKKELDIRAADLSLIA